VAQGEETARDDQIDNVSRAIEVLYQHESIAIVSFGFGRAATSL